MKYCSIKRKYWYCFSHHKCKIFVYTFKGKNVPNVLSFISIYINAALLMNLLADKTQTKTCVKYCISCEGHSPKSDRLMGAVHCLSVWSLIGQCWSRDLNAGLWLVNACHVTYILTSDWLASCPNCLCLVVNLNNKSVSRMMFFKLLLPCVRLFWLNATQVKQDEERPLPERWRLTAQDKLSSDRQINKNLAMKKMNGYA